MRQMAGKDEETSLEDSSFGPGHFIYTENHYAMYVRFSRFLIFF